MNLEFSQCRVIPESFKVHSNVASAWNRTRHSLADIRAAIDVADRFPEVVTIYVCGSLGRMEQLSSSDCDLVIVTDDAVTPDSDRGREIYSRIWQRLETLNLHRPKPNGIFSETVTRGSLVDRSTLGIVDEDQFIFGKRIQILLDSQPVYRDSEFETLQRDVLQRYRYSHAELLQTSLWSGLKFDLMRYFRALCIRTMWLPDDQPAQWRLLNIKLRHSRLLLYAGLMVLLHEIDTDELLLRLKQTPLERVVAGCRSGEAQDILNAYDLFLEKMNDPTVASELAAVTIPIEASGRAFYELIENSRALSAALSRLPVFQSDNVLRESLFI